MSLTRDELAKDSLRAAIRASRSLPGMWSDEQLAASRAQALASWDGRSDLWVFGYASLIWNPQLDFCAREFGRIHGYHRALCLWSRINRGTPERPGLVFGLKRGGSCHGVAYRIAGAKVEREFELLWRREMLMGSYLPKWLTFTSLAKERRTVLAFCVNPHRSGYAGDACSNQQREAIREASGRYGSCFDYVAQTLESLKQYGIRDRYLERMLRSVKPRQESGA